MPGSLRGLISGRLRPLFLLVAALVLLISVFVGAKITHAASYCNVTYTVSNQWPGGFGVQTLAIQNTSSSAWTSWTLTFTFPAAGQAVSSGWGGTFSQSGQNVTVTNLSYNGAVAANASVSSAPGFNGTWTTSNPVPTNFAVNGNACNGGTPPPTPTTPAGPTSTPVTNPPTPTATTQPGTPVPTPLPGTHVDNAYVGAQGYVNPDWAAEVKAGAAAVGGTLGAQEAKVAQYPTAVWLDSMAAISGTNGYPRSLAGHLDAAVAQATGSQPVLIELVIYDLPGRDCAALASNGEIPGTAAGLSTYEHSYIDPIAATINQAKYSKLRIVAIIEPDSLPNLVTNLNLPSCATANSTGNYVTGVQYALNKLHAISNVYNYIDIGHDGWLGWPTNFNPAVTLIANTIKGTSAGVNSADGFISDTANYTPVTEPLMTANQTVGGQPVRSEIPFYQWNTYIDEQSFDIAWRNAMIAAGLPSTIGMLIDTSRNGWGGPGRPTAASTSTDLTTFVNATRIDKRPARGDWCNQPGGLGIRPVANPAPGFDAYVWIKPPGESDGSSSLIPTGPANPGGKGFDRMCDPTYGGNALNNNQPSGAMANAPVSGAWFQAAFNLLVQNAFPAIS